MPPTLGYWDLHPEKNDTVLDKDRDLYFYTIEDGKSATIQVGIFCGKEYLDSGNVYLEVNGVQEDTVWVNAKGKCRPEAVCLALRAEARNADDRERLRRTNPIGENCDPVGESCTCRGAAE